MYQFYMTIGDWSDDGHGLNRSYLISSNAPVETVREAHYRIKDVTGVDVEDICSEYENDVIDAENVQRLQKIGYPLEDIATDGTVCMNEKEMARLWLFLLQKADPELKLSFGVKEEIPTLHFYGYDEKGRHISFVGYGVFLDC